MYLHCCYLRIRGALNDAGDEVGGFSVLDFSDITVEVFPALDAPYLKIYLSHLELLCPFLNITTKAPRWGLRVGKGLDFESTFFICLKKLFTRLHQPYQ